MKSSDVRFEEPSNSELPAGWRRPCDLTEAFLVAAAMEMEARRRINYASPFDTAVFPLLADQFKYDPFAGLLTLGGWQEATWVGIGGAGRLEGMSAMALGERLSRLPLLQLVWQYIDLVKSQFLGLDFLTLLQRLDGVILGQEGTILFATGLDRQMHRGDELAPAEVNFVRGYPISMPDYLHRLISPQSRIVSIQPNGHLRANDIWNVCFRIIERSSASDVLDAYAGRVEAVSAILDRGATLGRAGASNLWPGWPTDIPVSSGLPESAGLDAEGGPSCPSGGYASDALASADQIEVADWSSSVKMVAAGHSHSLSLRNDGTVAAFGMNDEGQCDVPGTAHGAVAVACGGFHSLALTSGGGVVAWGANLYRQAEPPPGLKGVTAIAGGHRHSLALLSDGTVIQWGEAPGYDQVPVDLCDVIAISAGYEHSMALTKDGQVIVWGGNDKGQLDVPPDLSDVESISAGGWQCFALRSDGSVAAWGEGGDGATAMPSGPMYLAIAGGYWHAIALGSDGVKAWGDNEHGQTQVPPLMRVSGDVVAIAAGGEHNIALRNDGSMIGWGRNDSGQIAFSRPISFSQPVKQDGSHEPAKDAVGDPPTVYGWGSTDDRLLGYQPELTKEQPRCVEGLTGVADVFVIGGTVYATLQDGAVWGWGANGSGQLNDGTTLDRYRPIQIPGLTGVARIEPGPIATGLDGTTWTWSGDVRDNPRPFPDPQIKDVKQIVHLGDWKSGALVPGDAFHAIRGDGTVVAWGRNDSGQLGNGSKSRADELVSPPAPVVIRRTRRSLFGKRTEVMKPLSKVVRLIRAGESVFALAADGSVWAWGSNRSGQLADGSRNDRLTPVRLDFASDVIQLCTDRTGHGFPWVHALTREGDVWKWRPEQGQNAVPVRIPELSGILEMSMGEGCAVALRNDRTVMAWHPNASFTPPPPAKVEGLDNVLTIIAGERSVALRADGTVATWFGQGDNVPDSPGSRIRGTYTAIPAQGLTGIRKVATGGGTVVALRDDGTLWAWGLGDRGQLGIGDDRHRLVPAPMETVGTALRIHGAMNTVAAGRQDGSLTAWGDTAGAANRLALSNDELRSGGPWDNALGLSGVTSVAVGAGSVVALRSDGTVWATRCGNGTEATFLETRPKHVRQLAGITAVASGLHTEYALDESGSVWAWGDAQRNQIGDGYILIPGPSMSGMVASREVPVRSLIPGRVVAIAASYETAYALHEDGTVWAWGNNEHGELGNGKQQDMTRLILARGAHVPRPARVAGLKNIRLIASGCSTAYAVATDGTVWGWGSNRHGQLGVGADSDLTSLPVAIDNLPPIVAISTSGNSTFATDEEGTVWAWGLNRDGQLGDGTQMNRRKPTQIPELHNAKSVICVGLASFALLPSG
ncbi:hypothetical protein [Tessaracoccus sp. MC1756]|uniref:RCC1 domain-containing protein n=1 Tax=Tessaracoccus sp. MC1756 TaxID=2760311 RepID=UPI0015FEC19F|nr:hypothetical protein [Tessaracoccus sp. MC1756]MBB1510611.1 hypothetical protein [Tessaracoccus sp. MC1756]